MITCIICSHVEKEPILMSNLDTIESNFEISLWEMIYLVTNIKLHLIDNMCSICKKCVTTAKHGYYFKQQCISAKKQQSKHLQSSNKEINTNFESDIKIDNDNVYISETFITYVDNFNSYITEDTPTSDVEHECKIFVEETEITNIEVEDPVLETSNESSILVNAINSETSPIIESIVHKCSSCDFESEMVHELELHVHKEHIRQVMYSCDCCNAKFSTIGDLKLHRSIHIKDHLSKLKPTKSQKSKDPKDLRCKQCPFNATTVSHLERHVLARHQTNGKSTCADCGKVCGNAHRLKKHMINYHSDTPNFKCNVCNLILSNGKGLRDHMNRHMNVRPYKCSQCPKSFSVVSSRNAHERNHHIKKDAPKKECTDCGEMFTRTYSLTRHRKKMHGEDVREIEGDSSDEVVVIDEAIEDCEAAM